MEYERGGVEGGERAIKKLLLFVLVLLALMAATAFLVVTWLRAEDAEERAVRAENQTALQVEELRKSEEARSVSKWEVGRLSQELSNSRGVETRLRQALVNEQAGWRQFAPGVGE